MSIPGLAERRSWPRSSARVLPFMHFALIQLFSGGLVYSGVCRWVRLQSPYGLLPLHPNISFFPFLPLSRGGHHVPTLSLGTRTFHLCVTAACTIVCQEREAGEAAMGS